MKKQISIVFILFYLSSQLLFSQWIAFDKSAVQKKPSVKILSTDNFSMLLEISLPGMERKESEKMNKTYQNISIPDYYSTLEIGKPQLPVIRELIGVPDFKTYNVEIVDSSIITFTGYNISPFQKPIHENETESFVIDEAFYNQDELFPINTIEIDKPGVWRDIRVSGMNVFPIKYNPKTKTLKVYTKLVVKVTFDDVISKALITPKPINKEWDTRYRDKIINYDYLPHTLRKTNSINTTTDYDYLIITAADYLNTIKPFAQWKTRKGLLSKVVSINDIGNNETSLKNYIISEYTNYNIQYVLLVGDISQVCWSSTGPGDYWFSLLTGGDLYPEIAVGRFSALSATEVENMIRKEINYETMPPNDSWVRSALLVAHKENAPWKYQGCSEEIRTFSYSDNPVFTKAYGASTSVGGNEATNAQTSSYINSGMGIINYRGHGSEFEWWNWNVNNESYTTSDANGLNNGRKLPVTFSIACDNASLDYSSDCLAEAFTKTNYGATAFLGATEPSYTDANHAYDKKLFETAFNTAIHNIGNISNAAAEYIIINYGQAGIANAKMYLWLGDPALELWTNTLQLYSNVQITDNGSSLSINAGVSGSMICVSSGDNGATYWQREDNVSSFTFNTSVRPLYITIAKHNYIPYTSVTGGTFTSNEAWFGNINVLGNITLSSSANLSIMQGSKIMLSSGVYVTANNTLFAQGTSTNNITFDRSGTSGSWGGIVFNSGSSGSIDYCNISHATTGITCSSTLPMIRHSTISNNATGIYVSNVGTLSNEISYNTIQNNTSRGISLYSASPKIYSNTISNNTYYGISTYQSSPYLYGNTITGHSANGLNFSYYSSAKLVPWNAYGYYWGRGNNKIKNNTGNGISASYMSNLYLGSSPYGGYNSICNNTGTELSAYYNCTVTAQLNWWGADPPNVNEFYPYQSTIDYTNALPTDPNPDPEQGMVRGPNGISNSSTINSVKSDLEKAYNLQLDGKFAEAIAMYDSYINANSTDSKSAMALVRIDECYKLSGKEGAVAYLDNTIKTKANKNNEFDVVSLELKNQYLIQDKRFEEAVTNFNKLAETYKTNKDVEKHSLFNAGYVYLTYLNDYKNASAKFAELATKYPDDELVSESEYLLGNLDANNRQNLASPNISQSDLPVLTDYALDQNYPNPFNPATTITYQLPNSGSVTLKIYDMLGNEVKTLVNEQKEMGRYSVHFDASSLASGMYVYQLRVNDYTATKKMLLLK